jgi:hypothetical protein
MSNVPFKRIVSKFVYLAASVEELMLPTFAPITNVSVPAPPSTLSLFPVK